MESVERELATPEVRLLWVSLQRPVGRYTARRAAQLAGVPMRTVYDWAAAEVLVPDYARERPKRWSYRDLVLLRFAAWLRTHPRTRDSRSFVAERIAQLRVAFQESEQIFSTVRSDGRHLFFGTEAEDRLSGQRAIADILPYVDEFTLTVPHEVSDLGRRSLWGPNLLYPTSRTSLFAWVMSGEPCIRDTRIPTATIFALRNDRQLTTRRISRLYPEVGSDDIDDALRLEVALRRRESVAA